MVKEIREDLGKAIRVTKIDITLQEHEQLTDELNAFVKWLEPLLTIDTAGIEQVLNCHSTVNVMREDRAMSGKLSELQKTTANFTGGFYQVPTIIEE